MWSSRKLLLPAAAALSLSGCGFTPLYGGDSGARVQQQMNEVAVGIIPDRTGQLLRLSLEDRLQGGDTQTQQRYLLSVSYNISVQGIGVQEDTSTTRQRFTANASWSLAPIGSPQTKLTEGQASTEDALNIIDQQYFALTLDTETVDRQLADEIAGEIAQQVAAYFKTHPGHEG